MTTQPLLNLNQFSQQPVLGQLALGIGSWPIVRQVVISPNQATALAAGQAVKYDTAVTANPTGLPPIIACAANAYADGYLLYDVQHQGAALTANVVVQIVLQGAVWMLVEGTTVDSGSVLEDGADVGSMEPFATTGNYPRGVSLDYATSGQLFRADLTPFTIKSAQAAAHS